MSQSHVRLIVEGRGNWVYTHYVGESDCVKIGRSADNDVRLGDLHSSSHHAEIVKENGEYQLKDLGSRNGTYLDGEKVRGGRLRNGSTIKIGITTMSFLTGDDESFVTQVTNTGGGSHPVAADESELEPVLERLDELKSDLDTGRAGGSAASLTSTVDNLQKELYEAKAMIRRLNVINEFGGVLSSETSAVKMLQNALNFMSESVEAENGFIMLVEPTTKKWAVRARFGSILDWSRAVEGDEKQQLPMSLTLVEQAIRTATPVVSQSALDDPRFDEAKSVVSLGIHSCMCFPMISGPKPVGVVYVDRRASAVPFAKGEEKLFESLTRQLAGMIHSKEEG